MAKDDVKSKVSGWCTAAEQLTIAGEPATPDTEFALDLRYGGTDGLPISVTLPSGASKLHISHDVELPQATFDWKSSDNNGGSKTFHDKLAHTADHRPGALHAAVATAGTQSVVRLTTWVYLDGLTQHSFMSAVAELQRSHDAVLHMAEKLGAKEHAEPLPQAESKPEPAGVALPAPAFTPTPSPSPTPAPTPQPAWTQPAATAATPAPAVTPQMPTPAAVTPAPVQPFTAHSMPSPQPFTPQGAQTSGFSPTHHVPPMGMQAWAAPDPRGQVVAHLAAHLPVVVKETRGAWANIVCSNGWTGWVDARLLVPGAQ